MTLVPTGHLAPEHAPAMIEERFAGRLLSGKCDEASQAKCGFCFITEGQEVATRCRRRVDVRRQAVPKVTAIDSKIPEPGSKIGTECLMHLLPALAHKRH
jgi:hypothetical protein